MTPPTNSDQPPVTAGHSNQSILVTCLADKTNHPVALAAAAGIQPETLLLGGLLPTHRPIAAAAGIQPETLLLSRVSGPGKASEGGHRQAAVAHFILFPLVGKASGARAWANPQANSRSHRSQIKAQASCTKPANFLKNRPSKK